MIELKIGKVHLHSVIKSKLIDNCNTKFFVSSFKKLCGVSLRDFARV